MNERIKQLYEQSMEQHVSNNMAWEELNPEKFAELIVLDCAGIAFSHVVEIAGFDDATNVESNIKQYFGVEE
jgi:hypothetical protein